jgi:hypothetical protein
MKTKNTNEKIFKKKERIKNQNGKVKYPDFLVGDGDADDVVV